MFTKKSLLLSYSLKLEPTDSLHSIFNGKLKKTINSRKPLLSSIDHRSLTKNSAKYQGIFRSWKNKRSCNGTFHSHYRKNKWLVFNNLASVNSFNPFSSSLIPPLSLSRFPVFFPSLLQSNIGHWWFLFFADSRKNGRLWKIEAPLSRPPARSPPRRPVLNVPSPLFAATFSRFYHRKQPFSFSFLFIRPMR